MRTNSAYWTAALTVMMLPGCMILGENYQRPATILPAQYSIAAEEGIAAQKDWWLLFQDDTLTALIQQAQQHNPSVDLAVARIQEAEAAITEVNSTGLPTVSASGSGKRERVTEAGIFPVFAGNPRSNYSAVLNASQEIEFWGEIARAKESARANYLGTRFAKETVMWSLSSLVAHHYLLVRSVDAQLSINQQNLQIAEQSLKLVKHRLEGGIASVLDVHQAQSAIDNLRLQTVELNRLRALSEHQLAVLTGDLQLKVANAHLLQMPVPPLPPAGLPASLLETRPDVRQAEQALIAANANIAVAKAAFYPSISLTGTLGGESIELGSVLKSAARIWSLGLNLNLPIFNAGRLQSRVDQASAKQQQALANYQIAVQTAFREVNDALVNLRQFREREKLATSRQTTAQKMLEVAQNRYHGGYVSYLEVLDAQRNQQEASLYMVQSRQEVMTATVALFKALGGGWGNADGTSEQTVMDGKRD